VAVVTAASKGLGRASAEALAAEGAKVVLNARSADLLEEVAAGMEDALVMPGDISDPDLPAQLVQAAVDRWGRIDVVVGNNGGPPSGRALEVDDEQFLAAVDGNMLSSVRLARAAVPHMRAAQWGRICFITSVAVRQPIPDLALSNAARAGLWAWTKTAAADLEHDGITVNMVLPGRIQTERVEQLDNANAARSGQPLDAVKQSALEKFRDAAVVEIGLHDHRRIISVPALQ
jgi:3-oxoacyl-[acyl-carrier protein] reductase